MASLLLDQQIGVDVVPAQRVRNQLTNTGFAAATQTDQGNVLFHAVMVEVRERNVKREGVRYQALGIRCAYID
jgi:hypothetical protein